MPADSCKMGRAHTKFGRGDEEEMKECDKGRVFGKGRKRKTTNTGQRQRVAGQQVLLLKDCHDTGRRFKLNRIGLEFIVTDWFSSVVKLRLPFYASMCSDCGDLMANNLFITYRFTNKYFSVVL